MTVDELIHELAKWPGNFEVYDECEFTVAINYCPKCGRKLTNQ